MPHFNGSRLRALREARDLSPELLGRLIGRTARSVRLYEAGDYTPPSDVLGAAADALGVPVDAFYDDSGPDNVGAADRALRKVVASFGPLTDRQRRRLAVLLTEPSEPGERADGAA